jgi:hypothetical protein
MPIIPQSGRVVIAESIAQRPIHVAWGTGDGAWITPPSEGSGATGLMAEIGRRTATVVGYVNPDVNGDIILSNSAKFTASATPTNFLHITASFDFADAPSAQIRETAVFVGTQVEANLPAGQMYFTPDEVVSPGRLLHIENIEPIFRSPAVKEFFEYVIAF